jgi:hypothetical protein
MHIRTSTETTELILVANLVQMTVLVPIILTPVRAYAVPFLYIHTQ